MYEMKGKQFFIEFDDNNETFHLKIFNKYILSSAITATINDDKANIIDVKKIDGNDKLGNFKGYSVLYSDTSKKSKRFTGLIKIYDGFVIFETINHFKITGKKNKHIFGNPYISFPCFEGDDWQIGMSVLSFKRQAPFNYPEQYQGRIIDSIRDGKHVPLIATNESFETIVMSPLTHLLHGTVAINKDPKSIKCGIPRAVTKIDPETVYSTLLVFGQGVNATIDRWGYLLRQFYDIKNIAKDDDVLLKYISYWTNAGSTYWYNTYHKHSYEETLRLIKKHHAKIGLKIGSYQLDSWWYKRENSTYTGGIIEWEPHNIVYCKNFNSLISSFLRFKTVKIFKTVNRLSTFQQVLNTPIGCHFKHLAIDSVYVKDYPNNFILGNFAIPKNYDTAKNLFKNIFNHPNWNLTYIMHDWLQYMADNHPAFNDIKVSTDYFKGLDDAVGELKYKNNKIGNVTLQLCMAQPNQTLNAVTMRNVTTIRSTCDSNSFFVEGPKRWRWNLYSSKFIQSLGKYAFYDNRFSYKKNSIICSQHPEFEMIWLGLSCGPIGLADKIGKENMHLIRRIINKDGEIIKPDVPSEPLDKCYLFDPYDSKTTKGVTVYSHSVIPIDTDNNYKIIYALSFNCAPLLKRAKVDYKVIELCKCHIDDQFVIFDYKYHIAKVVDAQLNNTYRLSSKKFIYHVIAPLINGIAFFGDISRHVSGSTQLINNIIIDTNHIIINGQYPDDYQTTWAIYSRLKPSKITIINNQMITNEYKYSYKNNVLLIKTKGTYKISYQLDISF